MIASAIETSAGFEPAFQLADYYPIFLLLGAVVTFAFGSIAAAAIIGPRRDTPVKLMPYESGMDPVGSARMQFDVKFYLIAILFLVFDVELLLLYPWATSAYAEGADPGWRAGLGEYVFYSIVFFLGLLVVAYVYELRKGIFKWR